MTIQDTPISFLNPSKFQFNIAKIPRINFTVQKFSIPGLFTESVDIPNPFSTIHTIGNHVVFEPLEVTFKVEQDFSNYMEIWNWLIAIGFPEDFSQSSEIGSPSEYQQIIKESNLTGRYSDASLLIYDEQNNFVKKIEFRNCAPTALGAVTFNTMIENRVPYITCQAIFSFDYFYFSDSA